MRRALACLSLLLLFAGPSLGCRKTTGQATYRPQGQTQAMQIDVRFKSVGEQIQNFFVRGLREDFVVASDGVEVRIDDERNHLVRDALQSFESVGRGDRSGDDDSPGVSFAGGQNGGFRCGAGREAVIDQ